MKESYPGSESPDKEYYRGLSRDGYEYGGYWDGLFRYQRERRTMPRQIDDKTWTVSEQLFTLISVTHEDLHNGNFAYFIINGLTRDELIDEKD